MSSLVTALCANFFANVSANREAREHIVEVDENLSVDVVAMIRIRSDTVESRASTPDDKYRSTSALTVLTILKKTFLEQD